jgi:fucose 4-O-acetylase-like acetyltransferase
MGAGTQAHKTGRLNELDYLKCVFIVLMICFHLVYIGETYPYAKRVVYTFHMPAFLIISGYLMNMSKPPRQFLRTMLWFAVPYTVMESGYIVMASLLPIREHIDQLTPAVFLDKLLLHPLGPYWYLHTLILCGTVCYAVFRYTPRLDAVSQLTALGLLMFLLSHGPNIVSLPNALYFIAGIAIRRSGLAFTDVFRPAPLAAAALALLAAFPANLDRATAGGVLIVYLAISTCLCLYPYIKGSLRRLLLFLGRNSLLLFVFSPIFTILCKAMVPYLAFDPTGLLFLFFSLVICIAGSLAIGYAMDIIHAAPFFFGRKTAINRE